MGRYAAERTSDADARPRERARVAAARGATGGPAAVQLLRLQASAGNHAVATVVQRYNIKYGALHNDCGTDMHVYIDGKNDPDLGKGSAPSVRPSWWPASGPVAAYLSAYVVQGHLLNQGLGGPGDTMKNLTPITKSTNTTHFKKIEHEVKTAVNADFGVEYRVRPDYTQPPKLADLGHSPPPGVAALLANMAGVIGADYDVYDRVTKTKVKGLPGELLIKNEGAHLKGAFV